MIRLPRTLHIEGSRLPQGKTDPEAIQFNKLAEQFLVIEEKLDGTGVSIFFDSHLEPQIWHRGSPAVGKEFHSLRGWVNIYKDRLFDLLEDRYILFGEWMFNKHTIFYDRLPHYFLESDIYDTKNEVWLSTSARNSLLTKFNFIRSVPVLVSFKPTRLSQITDLISKPLYQSDAWRESLWQQCETTNVNLEEALRQTDQSDLSEGLYIKHEDETKVLGRYKYVRYEFVETIVNSGSHVMDRDAVHNIALGGYSCLL